MDNESKYIFGAVIVFCCFVAGTVSVIGYFHNACIALVKDKPAIEIKLICK